MAKKKMSVVTEFGIFSIIYGGLMAVLSCLPLSFDKEGVTPTIGIIVLLSLAAGFAVIHILGIVLLIIRRPWPIWICTGIACLYAVLCLVGLARGAQGMSGVILPIIVAVAMLSRGRKAVAEIKALQLPPMILPADALVLPQQESQTNIPTIQLPADTPSANRRTRQT